MCCSPVWLSIVPAEVKSKLPPDVLTTRSLSRITGPLRRTSAALLVTVKVSPGPRPAVEDDGPAGDVDLTVRVDDRQRLQVGVSAAWIIAEEHAAISLRHRERAQGLRAAQIGIEGETATAGIDGQTVVFTALAVDCCCLGEEHVAARGGDREIAVERHGSVESHRGVGCVDGQRAAAVEDDGVDGHIGAKSMAPAVLISVTGPSSLPAVALPAPPNVS